MEARANYESINEQLTTCRNNLYSCKRKLISCNKYLTDDFTDEIEDVISDALAEIEKTYEKIDKTQDLLDSAEHPYFDELKKADPFKCHATGKGVEEAVVGEKATAVIQISNYLGEPCKVKVEGMECDIVSEITGGKVHGRVEVGDQCRYEISYQPHVKGIHQLHITATRHMSRGCTNFISQLPATCRGDAPTSYHSGRAAHQRKSILCCNEVIC